MLPQLYCYRHNMEVLVMILHNMATTRSAGVPLWLGRSCSARSLQWHSSGLKRSGYDV